MLLREEEGREASTESFKRMGEVRDAGSSRQEGKGPVQEGRPWSDGGGCADRGGNAAGGRGPRAGSRVRGPEAGRADGLRALLALSSGEPGLETTGSTGYESSRLEVGRLTCPTRLSL